MTKNEQKVLNLWDDMDKQNWGRLHTYFTPNAAINWHDSNESFNVEEFVLVNEKFPGDWQIKVEKLLSIDSTVVSVVKVMLLGDETAYHACSFFQFKDGVIELLDEYWGPEETRPDWRVEMGIGKPLV